MRLSSRCRFKIRTLILISTVVAIALFLWHIDRDYQQTVAELKRINVEFRYLEAKERYWITSTLAAIVGEERAVPIIGIRIYTPIRTASSIVDHLKWFPYLRQLELKSVDIDLRRLPQLKRLQELRIESCLLETRDFSPLRYCSNLRTIVIDECHFRSESAFIFPRMESLETLELNFLAIPDSGLGPLDRFPKLTSIRLLDVSYFGNQPLFAYHPQVKSVSIASEQLFNSQLVSLTSFPSLESLRLERVQSYDQDLQFIGKFSKLRELSVKNCPLDGSFLKHIAGNLSIERIVVSNCPISDEGLNSVPGLPSGLKSLCIVSNNLDGKGLINLQGLSNLHVLNLKFTPIKISLSEFPASTNLETLILECKNMETCDLRVLSKFPNLRELEITNACSDIDWSSVPRLEKLQRLSIYESNLAVTSLEFLRGFPLLESLSLDGCSFHAGLIAELRMLKKLKQLSVQRTEIESRELLELQRQLPFLINVIGSRRTPE